MIGYVKCFDSNKTMSLKVTDKKLLEKCNLKIKKFDNEPVYGDADKDIKTKIKIYGNANTSFQGKKVPKKMQHISVYH